MDTKCNIQIRIQMVEAFVEFNLFIITFWPIYSLKWGFILGYQEALNCTYKRVH